MFRWFTHIFISEMTLPLFKVKTRGVFYNVNKYTEMNCPEFTEKILLDSFEKTMNKK